jgi:hypothetical protein
MKPKVVEGKQAYTTITSQPYTELQHIVCVPRVRVEYSCACGGNYEGGKVSSAYKTVDELGAWLDPDTRCVGLCWAMLCCTTTVGCRTVGNM